MRNSVFRNSSIERVSSPEQLNDYIKVSNPSIWMVLIAAIIFLIGVIVWGIFGTLTTTQKTVGIVQNGEAICYISTDHIDKIAVGMEVQIGESIGEVYGITESAPIQIDQNFDSYAMHLGGYQGGEWVYPVRLQASVSDGIYPVKIMIEKISPISFLLN